MRLPARIVLCCLLVFMLCPANAQEKPQKIVLALHATPQGNALYIEAKLNGKPATLLLDTGSTVSLCDWKLCGKAPKATPLLELGSWHSDSAEDIRPRDLSSISLQMGIKLDGVLGLLTMAHFRRVTVDFQQHSLELEP
jgi:hypothetical protein